MLTERRKYLSACPQMEYQIAMTNNIKLPDSWVRNKKAGYDWYSRFTSRHKLSVIKPEAKSMARATAFNKHTVGQFYSNLRKAYEKHEFLPKRSTFPFFQVI